MLLKLGGVVLLATASHVIENLKGGPLLGGDCGEFFPLDGDLLTVKWLKKQDGTLVDVDLALLRMPATTAARYVEHAPIEASHCWFNDGGGDVEPFVAHGFPLSMQSRRVIGDEFKTTSYGVYLLEEPEMVYDVLGRDPIANLVVGFDKFNVHGAEGRKAAPNPTGVSGGGLWHAPGGPMVDSQCVRLAGILTTWRKTDPKVMIATRISVLLVLAGHRWPDLAPFAIAAMG